jgi:hypothetical protein
MRPSVSGIVLSVLVAASAWVGPAQSKDPWKHYYKQQEKQAKSYHKFQRKQAKEWNKYERQQARNWDGYERGSYTHGW